MALFAKVMGEGGAAPLVLLHGFGGSHRTWEAIQTELAAGRAVIAYDLPGHGGSLDYPDAGPAKRAAQAVIQDLTERGIERFHVAGHSMGGAIATLVAMLAPQAVLSATLLAPGGFGPEINHRLLTRYAAADTDESMTACLEAMFGWQSAVPEGLSAEVLEARTPARSDMLKKIAAGLVRDGKQGQIPRESLDRMAMPVSVAWGELDNVLPARQLRNVPAAFATHLFPDLGHMLPEEAPAAMVAIIRRTLAAGEDR